MVDAAARDDGFHLLTTVLADRFRVDALIAEGGFAVVYRACQVALDRRVAIKVLKTPAGYDQAACAEFRERFAAEARTIARLKHPHIVDVYDFAISALPSGELAPWMALEWVDGDSLETWLARRQRDGLPPLEPGEAVRLLRPAVEALAFAHRQGVVHRDVKPGNIMVVENEHGRTVRVLDFGIAKIMVGEEPAGSGRTRTGSVPAFSPAYAAPEQVTFSRTGPWTDVHALGLILTELVTGQAPFTDPEAAVHEQVMAVRRPTPASLGRSTGRLEAVIARAVALSPGERWRNAGEMLSALDEAIGDASATRTADRAGSADTMIASEAAAAGQGERAGRARRPAGRRVALVAGVGALLAAVIAAWALRGRPVTVAPTPTLAVPAASTAPVAPIAEMAAARAPEATPPVVPPVVPAATPIINEAPAHPARPANRRKKVDSAAAAPAGANRKDLFDDTK